MKKFLFFAAAIATFSSLSAQDVNQSCFLDTALVEPLVSRSDTMYMVKPQFCKGDWEIFYDFQLTKKKAEYHFDKYGNKTGVWKEWHANGKPAAEWNYTGALVRYYPPGKAWYANGSVKTERLQRNDTIFETSFFPDGKTSRIYAWTKDGAMFKSAEWCANGQQIVNYNPTSATPAPVSRYHCNGKVKSQYNWYAFGYVGAYAEFHENGKPAVKGQYEDLPPGTKAQVARKTGEWTYYDSKGNVTKTEKWVAGRLVK